MCFASGINKKVFKRKGMCFSYKISDGGHIENISTVPRAESSLIA